MCMNYSPSLSLIPSASLEFQRADRFPIELCLDVSYSSTSQTKKPPQKMCFINPRFCLSEDNEKPELKPFQLYIISGKKGKKGNR